MPCIVCCLCLYGRKGDSKEKQEQSCVQVCASLDTRCGLRKVEVLLGGSKTMTKKEKRETQQGSEPSSQ